MGQLKVFTGTYSEIALWFNWRPVGVADLFPIGPFHGVFIPQADPHAYRAALEQHGDVGCRNYAMTTEKQNRAVFLPNMPHQWSYRRAQNQSDVVSHCLYIK